MGWDRVDTKRTTAKHAVTVCTTAGAKNLPPLLTITLRLPQLPLLAFLTDTGTCDVLVGTGEHAGLIRLVPGEAWVLFTPGKKTDQSACVRMRAPDFLPPARRAPERADYTAGERFLEIRLPPAWMQRPPAPARTSIMDRVADPAAPLRGARR